MTRKKQQVLVTGSSGYLGSHLADSLDEAGYEVILFDKTPSKYKRSSQKEVIGDILDREKIIEASKGCKYVFHFAAQADIDSSSENVSKTIQSNILGTLNILEAAKKNNVDRIIFASSIYGYSDLGSFYRVSKQTCEKLIEEYEREYSVDYTILRYGSLYGPRANEFNSISKILTEALSSKKITRRGNGEEIREYIHVKDAAALSIKAIQKKFKNKHLIITGNQQIKVKDLLLIIKEILNNKIKINYIDEKDFHHYKITPFSYKPTLAERLVPETFHDLGQGILDMVYSIEEKNSLQKDTKKVSLTKRKKKKV